MSTPVRPRLSSAPRAGSDETSGGAAPRAPSRARLLLRAMRPVQWSKNLLVVAPIVLAHRLDDPLRVLTALAAAVAFCLVASAGYVVNDLLDRDVDRLHPRKRARPFAAGALTRGAGVALATGSACAGLLLAAPTQPRDSTLLLLAYLAATLLYSAWIKRALVADVVVLASLSTLRLVAGARAADVPMSGWLLAFSLFLFFSLAACKRCGELVALGDAAGRAYRAADRELVFVSGLLCGVLSVFVFALYLNSAHVLELYGRHELLWPICPVLLWWVLRLWTLARRGELPDDPVAFAVTDRASLLCGALCAALVFAAV